MQKIQSKFFSNTNLPGIALCVMVFVALISSSYKTIKIIRSRSSQAATIESRSLRFNGPKAYLGQQSSVGFLTDLKPGSAAYGAAIFQSQYNLAPLIVEDNRDAEYLIGDFSAPLSKSAIEQLEQQQQLQLVKDYQNGLLLFTHVTH